jgi:hypothetical protein
LQAIAQFAIIRKYPDFNIGRLKLDVLSGPALFQRGFNGPGLALAEISKSPSNTPDANNAA